MDPTISTDLKENMNTPRLAPSAIEVERLRMQMTMKNALGNNNQQQQQQQQQQQLDTVGEIPTINQRGVRRLKSSNPNMVARNASGPLAPTKSTDAAASIRGSAVARANSSRNLLQRATSSTSRSGLIPARTSSSQGLRPFNKDQIVNSSISRKPPVTDGILNMHIRGPGGTLGLQRNESEMSLGEFSISDGSLFTTDSVFVRKSQFIADPLDTDNTYDDNDSFADHESFMTRDSEVPLLYEMPHHSTTTTAASSQRTQSAATTNTSSTASSRPVMTLNDLESLKMHKLNISTIHQHNNPNNNDDISLVSYGTMATDDLDYTDGYANDETEYVE